MTDIVLIELTELLQSGALQVLEYVVFIRTRHGVGCFVSDDVDVLSDGLNWVYALRVASAMNLVEAGEAVEVACVGLAAQKADQEDIEELSGLLSAMQETDFMSTAYETEMKFHLSLA